MWSLLTKEGEALTCQPNPTSTFNCQIPPSTPTLEFFIPLFNKPKDQILQNISFFDTENQPIEIRSYRLRAIQYRPKIGRDAAEWRKLFLDQNETFESESSYRRLRFPDCFSLPLDNVQIDHRGFAEITTEHNDDIVWQFRAFFPVSNVKLHVSLPSGTVDASLSESSDSDTFSSMLIPMGVGASMFGLILVVALGIFIRNKIKLKRLVKKRKTSDPDLTESEQPTTSSFELQ